MELTPQISNQLAQLINDALTSLSSQEQEELITDFHITTNADNGVVAIYDDNDEMLAKTVVEGYEETDEEEFRQFIGKALKKELERMLNAHSFDSLSLFRPFSFVLADSEHESLEDLLVVDDDSIMVSDELLKGLDQELDDFINQLLK